MATQLPLLPAPWAGRELHEPHERLVADAVLRPTVLPEGMTADFSCLACGGPIEPALARLASIRCHDCRDDDLPLNPAFFPPADEAQRVPGPPVDIRATVPAKPE